eukprot:1024534-Pelagomonas_calceolata.AAC.1
MFYHRSAQRKGGIGNLGCLWPTLGRVCAMLEAHSQHGRHANTTLIDPREGLQSYCKLVWAPFSMMLLGFQSKVVTGKA